MVGSTRDNATLERHSRSGSTRRTARRWSPQLGYGRDRLPTTFLGGVRNRIRDTAPFVRGGARRTKRDRTELGVSEYGARYRSHTAPIPPGPRPVAPIGISVALEMRGSDGALAALSVDRHHVPDASAADCAEWGRGRRIPDYVAIGADVIQLATAHSATQGIS